MRFRPYDPRANTNHARRHLPHWQQPGGCYFVTFRLADSLPQTLLARWREERALWLAAHPKPWTAAAEAEHYARFGERFERWLDAGHGACELRSRSLREITRASILRFHGLRYDVEAFVVMPNHVHVLWQLRFGFEVSRELQLLKGATARAINRALARTGPFWRDESYDRLVRNAEELSAFRRYIAENASKAQLPPDAYTLELLHMLEP